MLRIGLVCVSDLNIGGGRTYEQLMLNAVLEEYAGDFEFTLFVPDAANFDTSPQVRQEFIVETYSTSHVSRLLQMVRQSPLSFRLMELAGWQMSSLERSLIRAQIDLVYFLSPNPFAAGISALPIISTIWDMAHSRHTEFPEVTSRRRSEFRDQTYGIAARKSVAIVVDSPKGKFDVVSSYGVQDSRVLPISFVSLVKPWGSPVEPSLDQVIYPAQFWPHKNHVVLLRALRLLLDHGRRSPQLILTGSDKGNLTFVKSMCRDLALEKNVLIRGFVPGRELKNIVLQSRGLVMPSFIGPTNLPPIEALKSGIPVAVSTSDQLSQHADNESVRAVDPMDVDGWADALEAFSEQRMKRPASVPPGVQEFSSEIHLLGDVLRRFEVVRDGWRRGRWTL